MKNEVNIIAAFALFVLLVACDKKDEGDDGVDPSPSLTPVLPATPFNYSDLDLPDHFDSNGIIGGFVTLSATENSPPDNPVTDDGATLGRVLFYDKQLSQNGTISCASCHRQEHGFSDPDVFSVGFLGEVTPRHSMGLTNAAYYSRGRFFWDERAETLEDQVLMPIQDPIEMGMTLEELEQRVQSLSYYHTLFEDAFGDGVINRERISRALAQFVRSMVSYQAPYDIGRAQVSSPYDGFPNFTESENLGKTLFMTPVSTGGLGCTDCHSTEGFVNIISGPTSNGLDSIQDADDLGYYAVSGVDTDLNTFKAPSLKNVAVRPPYMHDGRFASLEEVIEHYDSGINFHPSIPFTLIDSESNPVQFDLRPEKKQALLDFLHTLTDQPMLVDEKFSDPFE